MKFEEEFSKIRDAFKDVKRDISSIKSKFITSDLDISEVRRKLSAEIESVQKDVKQRDAAVQRKIGSQNAVIQNHKKTISKQISEAKAALKESINSFDADVQTVQKNADILREELQALEDRQEKHEKVAKNLDVTATEIKKEAEVVAEMKRELRKKIEQIDTFDTKVANMDVTTKETLATLKKESKRYTKNITAVEKEIQKQKAKIEELHKVNKKLQDPAIQKKVTAEIQSTIKKEFLDIQKDVKKIAEIQEKVNAESMLQKEALAARIDQALKDNQAKDTEIKALTRKIESLEKQFEKKLDSKLKQQANTHKKEVKQMITSVKSAKNKKDLKKKLKKSNGNTFKDFMFNLFFEEVPEKTRAEKLSKEQPKEQKANN